MVSVPMKFITPLPLKREHDELHAELASTAKLPGAVGAVARDLAAVLTTHLEKEEAFALPPLCLLSQVATGRITSAMAAVTTMTDHLRAELPTLLAEHARITTALQSLAAAARDANDFASVRFAEKFLAHIQLEELLFYPAAILLGDYIRGHLRQGISPALQMDGQVRIKPPTPPSGSD